MSELVSDSDRKQSPPSGEEPEFRLSRTWIIVGIVAVLVGALAGLVMSSSWLR
jgi:hypothetical protein